MMQFFLDSLLTAGSDRIILVGRNRRVCYRICIVLAVFFGQTAGPETILGQSDPIVVRHADSWRGAGVDDVFHLIGNVLIVHGETTLRSDYVQYRKKIGELILDGEVRIERDQTTLFANHVVYYESNRQAVARGGVRIVDAEEGVTLTGNDGEYFHETRYALVTGSPRLLRTRDNEDVVITGRRVEYYFAESDSAKRAVVQESVTVIDRAEQITVICERVDYSQEPERAFLTGSPRLVKSQTDAEEQIVVTGQSMVYAFAEKHADVYDSVTITRGELQGVCDTLSYDREQAHLIGNPVLREGNNDIRGDDILLNLTDDSISEAVVTGRAKASYAPEDSTLTPQDRLKRKKSTIEGRTLTVSFEDETVKEIVASQNATSIYQPPESTSDEGPPGHNRVSASEITITLDRGQLVNVSARGGVIGVYKTPVEDGSVP